MKISHRDMCRLFPSTNSSQTYCLIFITFILISILEPIVEIRASVDISMPSGYSGTPIPMICIAKQSDYVKEQLVVSKTRDLTSFCLDFPSLPLNTPRMSMKCLWYVTYSVDNSADHMSALTS